ncbi:MAG: helix-turn-helix domain-containing protein [Eubacteriales bacterium]|nr:helix-turn-helix domain-containing protein [Eubacteriales bacterium]
MEINEKLKEARKTAGLTQEEVAEKVLVSRVTISNWENGKSLPDIASLISLSDLYNISLDELVKGDSKMTEKIKKDTDDLKERTRIIITLAVVAAIFGIAFVVCRLIGGGAKDFAVAAAPWVFMGIGIAGAVTFFDTTDKSKV